MSVKVLTGARCAELEPDRAEQLFYLRRNERKALELCQACPVRLECLEDALAAEAEDALTWGVRGGLTALERRALLARQQPP